MQYKQAIKILGNGNGSKLNEEAVQIVVDEVRKHCKTKDEKRIDAITMCAKGK